MYPSKLGHSRLVDEDFMTKMIPSYINSESTSLFIFHEKHENSNTWSRQMGNCEQKKENLYVVLGPSAPL